MKSSHSPGAMACAPRSWPCPSQVTSGCLSALPLVVALGLLGAGAPVRARAAVSQAATIISPSNASYLEKLAAHEVRRYVYLCTGELLSIRSDSGAVPARSDLIVVARRGRPQIKNAVRSDAVVAAVDSLGAQSYWLVSLGASDPATKIGHSILVVAGGDDAGTLYAAYRLAEVLGVRFYLHGDVVPDGAAPWRMPLVDERSAPLFALRGIQPFHDFPEGPDWWNRDDYLAVIGQLPKLRMNFFGLHTYPEGAPNAEPTVWIGTPADVGKDGRVGFSYPASYQNTLRGNWGYAATKTSDYVLGSAELFERDAFGPDALGESVPAPTAPEASNRVFDQTAALLREAFSFAHQLGVKTCVGTETPLVVPKLVQERLKQAGKNPSDLATVQELYEGIFRRAALAYPLDYYWFWTPEGWTWSAVKEEQITATKNDFAAAIAAHRKVQPPFGLATCGWVLGPQQDRALFDKFLPKDVAVSCINREVGYTPVDAGFADVKGRSKWAIPWLEDDPALTSPQLWVGRMRRDAADALAYGCDGLMGIHWRTRILGPNVSALAQAAWEQRPWVADYRAHASPPPAPRVAGPVGGQVAAFPNNPIAGTDDPTLYQTVRYGLSAYHLPLTNGLARVSLKFCEPHYQAAGKRAFDVKLQGRTVITNLDIFARAGKDRALDYTFPDIAVTNGWLNIDFVPRIEFPSIAAIAVEGAGLALKINCGGPAYKDYLADLAPGPEPKPLLPSTRDFYRDWASHQFGRQVGPAAAEIFERIDGALPKPSVWTSGPGGIRPDPRPWEDVGKDYAFVKEFAALSPEVHGPGNVERFNYWLNTFLYFRAIGEANCAWAEYERALAKVKQEKDPAARQALARQEGFPARRKLVLLVSELYDRLLSTLSTPGELGTVANWNQHNLPELLTKPGEELARLTGAPLLPELQPGRHYRGPARIVVPAVRSSLKADERLTLKILILSETPPRQAGVYWRKLGEGRFDKIPLQHVARGVYSAALPPAREDFEYYVQAEPAQGSACYYPATAPQRGQTIIVVPN